MTNRAARHLSALARCAAVLREYEAGESYAVIGKRMGVTRQRAGSMAAYARLQADLAFKRRDTDTLQAMAPEPEDPVYLYVPNAAPVAAMLEARASIALDGETMSYDEQGNITNGRETWPAEEAKQDAAWDRFAQEQNAASMQRAADEVERQLNPEG